MRTSLSHCLLAHISHSHLPFCLLFPPPIFSPICPVCHTRYLHLKQLDLPDLKISKFILGSGFHKAKNTHLLTFGTLVAQFKLETSFYWKYFGGMTVTQVESLLKSLLSQALYYTQKCNSLWPIAPDHKSFNPFTESHIRCVLFYLFIKRQKFPSKLSIWGNKAWQNRTT